MGLERFAFEGYFNHSAAADHSRLGVGVEFKLKSNYLFVNEIFLGDLINFIF